MLKRKFLKQNLKKFEIYRSGDMRGSSHSVTVKTGGDGMSRIIFSDTEDHSSEPVIREYTADMSVLDGLKAVFLKYRMYRWKDRKFTDIFVCDGATTSYRFSFDDDEIYFSSQIFSPKYSRKLSKLREIIDSCCEEENIRQNN